MNQTWENFEKPNFGSDFGSFGPHFGAILIFFVDFTSISS